MASRTKATALGAALLQIAAPALAQTNGLAALPQGGEAAPVGPATAPYDPSRATAVWQSNDAAWSFRYSVARQRLLSGDFREARLLFGDLARTATTAADRALAAELAGLATDWASRDLAFVSRADLGESQLSAKALNERTTDEIAVLYGNAALYGLGTGGWLAAQTEPDTAAGVILPALGFAAAAAGAVAVVDRTTKLHYGVPQSIVSGMYIGLQEGIVWAFWNQARTARVDEWKASTVATVIWGMSTAGAVAGGVIGQLHGSTPGRASFVGSAALWTGAVAGLTAGALFPADDAQDDRALLAGATGLNIGAVLGALAAGPVSPSIARVRFLDLGAIAGSVLVGGIYWAAVDNRVEDNGVMGSLALGATAGLGAAWWATQGMAPDQSPSDRPAPPAGPLGAVSSAIVPTAGGAMLAVRGEL